MTDTGQDIAVPDSMTIQEAEALSDSTQGRFNFELTVNPTLIRATWRNYVKKSGKRVWVKVEGKNDHYELSPIKKKLVVIK
jgi:hypothetical protein